MHPASHVSPVYPAYNPSFSVCFFSRNSIFLSQQISQQCFSTGLSAQPNGPLPKLGAMKRKDDAHLQLVHQAEEFNTKLDILDYSAFLDDGAYPVLHLPEDGHGVYEDLISKTCSSSALSTRARSFAALNNTWFSGQ
jgi:hypothetical protein